MRLFCFGYGYSAESLARRLSPRDLSVAGTRRSPPAASEPGVALAVYKGDQPSPEVSGLLHGSTHVLVSIPPDLEGDVVLRHYREDIAGLSDLAWIGYLSTVGVYGDHKGAWVDEESSTAPILERSLLRLEAEQAWLAFAGDIGRRVEVFRLAGIYGPGRSVIDSLRAGTASSSPARSSTASMSTTWRECWRRPSTRTRGIACTTSATTSRRRPRTWWPMPPSCWGCRPRRPLPSSRPD
jgi:hypothetical protein